MTRPAPWLAAFPEQRQAARLKPPKRKTRRAGEQARYLRAARTYVAACAAAGMTCPVVATIPELRGCDGTLTQCHHMRGRGYGGRGPLLMDTRHWLAVSAAGHDWIGRNKDAARAHGWLCARGLWNTPDRTPCALAPEDAAELAAARDGIRREMKEISNA